MIRLLVWRLSFEALNLLKILGFRGKSVHYFAFGANTCPDTQEIRRLTVLKEDYCRLENHELRFDQQGEFVGKGFASIWPSPGHYVLGKCLEIPSIDLWRLHCYEAAFALRLYTVRFADSMAYYQATRPKAGLLPGKEYRDKILGGLKNYPQQSDPFLEKLRSHPLCESNEFIQDYPLCFENYSAFGRWLAPILKAYDRLCLFVFVQLIERPSLFGNLIPR